MSFDLETLVKPHRADTETAGTQSLIDSLGLLPHPEGGYYKETDRDIFTIPTTFPHTQAFASHGDDSTAGTGVDGEVSYRPACTSIFYLLTTKCPWGWFHRNRGKTVHTLHKGRGRYIIIHQDGSIESFIVGQDVAKGERLQWIVDGGKYKASMLLPVEEGTETLSEQLLISEVVVPGFEFRDNNFMDGQALVNLVGEEKAKSLEWLIR